MKHLVKQRVMKLTLWIPAIIAMIFALSSCTDQQRAKSYGGTSNISIERGYKVVNVTWKDNNDLWIVTRKMKADEQADTVHFFQHSGKAWKLFGGDGQVILYESK